MKLNRMNPSVSVIMAAYNCAPYINQAINSVLSQTWSDLEIIVVDDGSTDGSSDILEQLSREDNRIRVFHQTNSGRPSIARNSALKHARGRYICFLDADDFYENGRIELLLHELIKHQDWVAVFHDMKLLEEDGLTLVRTYLSDSNFVNNAAPWISHIGGVWFECRENFYHFMSLKYAAIHTSTILINSDKFCLSQILFNENFSICEDTDLWIRLGMAGKLGYCDMTLSNYRQHPTSITQRQSLLLRETARFHEFNYTRLQQHLSNAELSTYRIKISNAWLYLGYDLFCQLNSMNDARIAYLQAFLWHPSIKIFTAFLKTFIPKFVIRYYQANN